MAEGSCAPCVLVVDDSPTVRMVVTRALARAGYKVVEAKDGFQAVEYLNGAVPALALLDIVLPGVDGYTLCKVMRSRAETRLTPIVLLSARDGFFDRIRGKAAGADGYLVKPFAAADLLAEVRRVGGLAGPAAAG